MASTLMRVGPEFAGGSWQFQVSAEVLRDEVESWSVNALLCIVNNLELSSGFCW